MNKKKLEIIKKVLGVDEWTLGEDREKFPSFVFVFDGNGNYAMIYDEKNGDLFYRLDLIHQKIKSLFGFNDGEVKQLVKVVMEQRFGWKGVTPSVTLSFDALDEEPFRIGW